MVFEDPWGFPMGFSGRHFSPRLLQASDQGGGVKLTLGYTLTALNDVAWQGRREMGWGEGMEVDGTEIRDQLTS